MWLQDFLNILDQHLSRQWLREQVQYEFCGVMLPYVLRAGAVSLFWWALKKLCGGDLSDAVIFGRVTRGRGNGEAGVELAAAGVRERSGGGDGSVEMDAYDSWDGARRRLGFTKQLGVAVSVARVLLWHWLQPLLYFLVFYAYSDLLNTAQLYLGLAVAAREFIYIHLVVLLVFRKPGFFLFSPSENDYFATFFYVVMPETMCILYLTPKAEVGPPHSATASTRTTRSAIYECAIFILIALDVCGAISVMCLILNQQWYWPLMIGFLVTAIGGVIIILGFVMLIITCLITWISDVTGIAPQERNP